MTRFRATVAISFGSLLLGACASDPQKTPGTDRPQDDGFARAESVRIAAPTQGEVVEPRFTLRVDAGRKVDSLAMRADGNPMNLTFIERDGLLEAAITLPSGEHALEVEGIASDGTPLARHAVTVRVQAAEDEPWVMVTSPRDGETISNPVVFSVRSSREIDTVELFADDWSLGTTTPDGILAYTFNGTDYARQIEAVGYDNGVELARTALTITVAEASSPDESPVNDRILRILQSYPTDGTYTYWWPDDSYGWGGNPHDIYYRGSLFAAGDEQLRSYCVGITFEVFMQAFDELDEEYDLGGELNGVAFDELYELRTDWYVRDLYGMGIVDAMDNYGIGQRVSSWSDLRPGDIIQFWRHSGSGHNAIFIDWERNSDDQIIGFTYWSTQGSTDGIGYNDEYFGSTGSSVDPNYFFAGRVAPPEAWTPWW